MSFSGRTGRQGDLFAAEAEDDVEHDGYLAIGVWPRDCANAEGYRPCPYVRCRHHLLIDEVYSGPGLPGLALSRARDSALVTIGLRRGRRTELSPEPTTAELDAFEDDAIARLWELPDTCAREVARRHRREADAAALHAERPEPLEAMTFPEIAAVLGVADPDELVEELAVLADGLRGMAVEAGADPTVEDVAIGALARR